MEYNPNGDNQNDQDFIDFKAILASRSPAKKAPAYPWQDLALRIIQELAIPPFKKSAVFKVCRDNSKDYIEKCLNETKELAQGQESWRYFFKVVDNLNKPRNQN